MANLRPDQLQPLFKTGKFAPAYLFDGPENWLKERWVQKFESKLITKEARDFNFNRYSASNTKPAEIISTAQSLPFLSDKRLLIVSDTDDFTAAEQKIIAEGISDLPPQTCIIFLYEGKALLREAIPAQVSSLGSIITFWTPFDNQLPGWITAESKARGKVITWDAARTLAESCANLQEISNELDKLILYVGKKNQITLTELLNFGLPNGGGDYFDLEEAVWSRDMPEALKQSESLHELGKRGEYIFPIFERVFRTLILGHHYINNQKMSLVDVYSNLGMRGKLQQNKFQMGLRRYKPKEVNVALKQVVQADFDLKTGRLPSEMAVSLLIVNLMKGLAFR